MTHYLLSVHGVEGEVREPLTDEEMVQSHQQLGVLEEELKSAGAWVVSPAVCTTPPPPPWCAWPAARW
jgi:hypothetical protein